MTPEPTTGPEKEPTTRFLARLFGLSYEQFHEAGSALEMSGVITRHNEPEFWADMPWRIEPDRDHLPVSFHVRDANIESPGKGPWRLDLLRVEQRLPDGGWHRLLTVLPDDLPDVDSQGFSQRSFWVWGSRIPIAALQGAGRGERVHLRALFVGAFPPHEVSSQVEIHLETLLAEHSLPLGRAAPSTGARQWFYGDTHYHSAYTNDVKEFGGALPQARQAGQAAGLDWLVVTDHSCDLDDDDEGHDPPGRWDRLKAEITSPQMSDGSFRFILGEEITLLGEAGLPLHMLAFGTLEHMIEGAFLQEDAHTFPTDLARTAIERILDACQGYDPDIPRRLFGRQHPLVEVLAALPPGTLAFAAHPFDVAQVPPARWGEADLTQRRLTGYEFFNGRVRAGGRATCNPFDRASWQDQDRLRKADAKRIAKLKGQAKNRWDPQLVQGVREWTGDDRPPQWRPVFIGGSDAHCDFNYHVGWAWDYRRFNVDDNALGRVRTVVHLPDHDAESVPPVPDILAAIEKGACLVTGGPVVETWMEAGADRAGMGDVLVVAGNSDLALQAVGHSTAEFGPVEQVEVVTYFHGDGGSKPQRTAVQAGTPVTLDVEGKRGFCRVEAQTVGMQGEGFCCFTNPVWVRIPDGKPRRLRITLT